MQMRHHVTETGQIDLVWLRDFPHRGFNRKYHVHQTLPLGRRQIGHFPDMGIQDDAAKTRVMGVIDPDHAAKSVGPEDISRIGLT
jgi:hypothetical protein